MLDLETDYWARYCEENVWHLCGRLPAEIEHAHALFVSGEGAQVAMRCQRAAGSRTEPVAWDYHVVLLGSVDGRWKIWDADSWLPSPQPAKRYLDASFPALPQRLAWLRPRFRLVEADAYRRTLCSDRRHMRTQDGGWQSPPPPTAPIGRGSNLMRFIDSRADFVGQVCDLRGLRQWLASHPASTPT